MMLLRLILILSFLLTTAVRAQDGLPAADKDASLKGVPADVPARLEAGKEQRKEEADREPAPPSAVDSRDKQSEEGSLRSEPAAGGDAFAAAPTVSEKIIKIKPSDQDENLYSIELRGAALIDLFRLMARDYGLNIIVDDRVSGTITATLNNISIKEALDTIMAMKNLRMEKKGSVIIIEPDLTSKIFVLRYLRLSDIVQIKTTVTNSASAAPSAAVSGGGVSVSAGGGATATQTSTSEFTGQNDFQRCLSDDGYVIPSVQSNSFMVVDYPENIQKVEKYVQMADRTRETKIIKLQYINANDLIKEAK